MSYSKGNWTPLIEGTYFVIGTEKGLLGAELTREELSHLSLDANEAYNLSLGYELAQQRVEDINPGSKILLVDTMFTVREVLPRGAGYYCIQFEEDIELFLKYDRTLRVFVDIQ